MHDASVAVVFTAVSGQSVGAGAYCTVHTCSEKKIKSGV